MRKVRRGTAVVSLALASALALSACSSSDPDEGGASSESTDGGMSTGIVTANGSEPQNPLIPTNTNEVGGGRILDMIFAGLVYYDADGAPHNEVADSIESEDGQNYTITIKDGWTFTDGTAVTAQSFVDAWNWASSVTWSRTMASRQAKKPQGATPRVPSCTATCPV